MVDQRYGSYRVKRATRATRAQPRCAVATAGSASDTEPRDGRMPCADAGRLLKSREGPRPTASGVSGMRITTAQYVMQARFCAC